MLQTTFWIQSPVRILVPLHPKRSILWTTLPAPRLTTAGSVWIRTLISPSVTNPKWSFPHQRLSHRLPGLRRCLSSLRWTNPIPPRWMTRLRWRPTQARIQTWLSVMTLVWIRICSMATWTLTFRYQAQNWPASPKGQLSREYVTDLYTKPCPFQSSAIIIPVPVGDCSYTNAESEPGWLTHFQAEQVLFSFSGCREQYWMLTIVLNEPRRSKCSHFNQPWSPVVCLEKVLWAVFSSSLLSNEEVIFSIIVFNNAFFFFFCSSVGFILRSFRIQSEKILFEMPAFNPWMLMKGWMLKSCLYTWIKYF